MHKIVRCACVSTNNCCVTNFIKSLWLKAVIVGVGERESACKLRAGVSVPRPNVKCPSMEPTSVICKAVEGRGSTELAGQLVYLNWWAQRLMKDPISKYKVEQETPPVKEPAAKTNGLSLSPRACTVEEPTPESRLLFFTHAPWPVCPPPHTCIYSSMCTHAHTT